MRPQPLIAVSDVEASSRWYQRLLGMRSAHGGAAYEQLVAGGQLVLQLHSFAVEHHHGRIGDPQNRPYGNGVLLWFEVDDFDRVMERAAEMGVEIVLPKHKNPPEGDGGPNHWECWMRDPDGYTIVVASPYGTAGGTWRPNPWQVTGPPGRRPASPSSQSMTSVRSTSSHTGLSSPARSAQSFIHGEEAQLRPAR